MFFSCLIHSARFSFIWGVEASKESSSAFCFSSEGFPFLYQGEQIVSISTAAPFHWLFGFHSALEETTQTFQKKWSVLKSAFLAPKNSFQSWFMTWISFFPSLFSRNMKFCHDFNCNHWKDKKIDLLIQRSKKWKSFQSKVRFGLF